jgi:hypothetical protein
LTSDWWHDHRHRFDLFTSVRVEIEAASGDAVAAAHRLQVIEGIPLLEVTEQAAQLAKRFLGTAGIPVNSTEDALQVAIATVHGMDYLLTWNCRDIANGEIIKRLAAVAADAGLALPGLCAPEQLMGN